MTALHVGVTARKGHIAQAVWKGKRFSQKKVTGPCVLPSHWAVLAAVKCVSKKAMRLKPFAVGAGPVARIKLAGLLGFILVPYCQQAQYPIVVRNAKGFTHLSLG